VESGGIRAGRAETGCIATGDHPKRAGAWKRSCTRGSSRDPDGRGANPARRAFLARARAAQAELRKAEEELDQLGEKVGSVAFGVSPTAA